MRPIEPTRPQRLDPLGTAILEELQRNPDVARLVILGGNTALSHYCEYRASHDVDAWWSAPPSAATLAEIEAIVARVASREGLTSVTRRWGDTVSFELRGGGKPAFSFQIAIRDRQLQPPHNSPWPPILLESLEDNVASKMNALVDRGAPRDFLDIYELIDRGIVSVVECWALWQEKHPDADVDAAKAKVLHSIAQIQSRRPLEAMSSDQRATATRRREFFSTIFVEGSRHD